MNKNPQVQNYQVTVNRLKKLVSNITKVNTLNKEAF
jgi:hypothetical protein